ncbi:MAG: polyprenol monophosphomannose synthase [Acidimicrobiales bacterium]|nr:polyprenol monophosphomannose synthase [Acidimicrobiales bacterium]
MRTVVVVPTYQEAENVERFLRAVRATVPAVDLAVVDDDSPDGTGQIADRVGAELGRVEVIHRPGKEGLGAAYRQGFRWAIDAGYDVVVQMDCDFSHDPAVIPELLSAVDDGVDCAIGSRYVPGGSTPGWPLHRRLLSRYGNRYTAFVLQLPIRDTTGGFRAYRAATLEAIDIDGTRANGYAFQNETAFRMVHAGLRLDELPITFVDRAEGTSKMSVKIMAESMARVTLWGIKLRLRHWRQRRA